MFRKILIANRGEIACRVIKTCRRLGIETVAVYSEADQGAPHTKLADQAIAIGPSESKESYLSVARIIAAVKEGGAEAVHPGYGFLSEKAEFAAALAEAGIVFIGPPPAAVAAMGDKIESKKIAREAGVNVIPGFLGIIDGPDAAAKVAAGIGYPGMLKATAGGGGKGMRMARNEAELREGYASAGNEAQASFGDSRMFVEKFIVKPRHIEIQILGDQHGNIVYLGERECSIQRRHQKVIEEAPSAFIDAVTRKAMGEQAVRLARRVGYFSAGTVEFVVGEKRDFYFLEMNTRLQVEHPVTELVTGIDLVEQMIRVAAKEKLPFSQDDIKLDGWALEGRLYAEDPMRGFLPSIGRLSRFRLPAEGRHVRVDTGVVEGSEISRFYDPMIAKLCAWGENRHSAIHHMQDALDRTDIAGIAHNVTFLAAVFKHPRFGDGALTTGFLAEEFPDGFHGAPLAPEERRALLAAAVFAHLKSLRRDVTVSRQAGAAWPFGKEWVVGDAGEEIAAEVIEESAGGLLAIRLGGEPVTVESAWHPGVRLFHGSVGEQEIAALISRNGAAWRLTARGAVREVTVRLPRAAELARLMPEKKAPDLSRFLVCPMPGLVVSIAVKAGDPVKAGQSLAVVEAMKMENVLRAERDGEIGEIRVKPGDTLAVDQVILEFA